MLAASGERWSELSHCRRSLPRSLFLFFLVFASISSAGCWLIHLRCRSGKHWGCSLGLPSALYLLSCPSSSLVRLLPLSVFFPSPSFFFSSSVCSEGTNGTVSGRQGMRSSQPHASEMKQCRKERTERARTLVVGSSSCLTSTHQPEPLALSAAETGGSDGKQWLTSTRQSTVV